MDPVGFFLLTIAGIFLVGAGGEELFRRTGIPDVIWLVVVGILLGPVTGLVPRSRLVEAAPYFAALTLVVILFDGGIRIRVRELANVAPRSGLLAVLGFVTATVAVMMASMVAGQLGWLPDGWSWSHGLMLGTILGGSSSIIIMPAMTLAGVREGVADLVRLESAFTDAFCVVGTIAVLQYLQASPATAGSSVWLVTKALTIGLVAGVAAGVVWSVVLLRLPGDHAYPITLSVLLLLYVGVGQLDGSAAVGVIAFAVVVGNRGPIESTATLAPGHRSPGETMRGVHGQVAFIVKSFFFTFIGAMLQTPWASIVLGVVLGFVLLLVRWPIVRVATARSEFSTAERRVIGASLPRGLAAGVLATFPGAEGIPGTAQIPSVVYACVVATIVIFAVGLPLAHRGIVPPEEEKGEPDARGDGEASG